MKKIISLILLALTLTSCNFAGYDLIDTNYHFNKAIIKMPNGETKEIDIYTWADAEGEQLTITDKNGNRYLVSSVNCILIEESGKDNETK